MKFLPIFICLVFGALSAFGQAAPEKFVFCGQQYALPAEAKLVSPYEVRAETFDVMLMYINFADLATTPKAYAKQQMKKLKGADMQELTCFIQDTPAKAYKFGYQTERGMAYDVLAYGIAKGQPVMIELTLDVDPFSNQEIPEFARQFVRLSK